MRILRILLLTLATVVTARACNDTAPGPGTSTGVRGPAAGNAGSGHAAGGGSTSDGDGGTDSHRPGQDAGPVDGGTAGSAGTGAGAEAGAGTHANAGSGPGPDAGPGDAGHPVPSTDPGLRVAFLGDQGIGASAVAVLQLIKREHADLVIHAGDLAYTADVAGWNAQIDAVLGADFPYFAAIGNHDVSSWTGPTGFQAVLDVRLDRIAGAACSGDLGVNSVCRYRGLVFVLSGVGTYGQGHEAFLDAALNDPAVWRLCVWHKNQHDMQVGTKPDEVGWLAYQTCQAHGSPIITGHEHSYARTYTLGALGDAVAQYGYGGAPDQLVFAPGSTAVFQTGLGGQSYRVWNGELAPWWATIYAANKQQLNAVTVGTAPQIAFGALFIDFHVDGDPYKAHGYFKTTNDDVVDDFTMRVTP